MKTYSNIFNQIICQENLFRAWDEFKVGKRNKSDVQEFEMRLEENIFQLHRELKNKKYKHGALFEKKGIPIGNLTSQLFANIYLNQLDQYIKHQLKMRHYIRYTDDFVIVHTDPDYLRTLVNNIVDFLKRNLKLSLHPQKITIRKFHQGMDFLGYILLPHHRLLRAKTKQRIFRKLKKRIKEYKNGTINKQTLEQSFQSYLGVLSHANTHKLEQELKNQCWFWLKE